MTIDLFTLPHKALRALVGLTATRLGAIDIADAGDVERMRNELNTLVDDLESHGGHEDEFIVPLLERHLPDIASKLRAEHADVSAALTDLRRGVNTLGASMSEGTRLALYRQLRRFEGLNLRHLDFEESVVMPALWQAAPAHDLADLMAAFHAAHPEAGDLFRRAPQALTAGERALVGAFRSAGEAPALDPECPLSGST